MENTEAEKQAAVKYTETYIPTFADCDKKYDLKPSVLMAWASETAGNHLRSRGITREKMWEDGQVFLLTKAAIAFESVPVYNSRVKVTTWECGCKGSQFIRRFRFTDSEGNHLCDAETMWALVDPCTRRLYRPSEYIYGQLISADEVNAKIQRSKTEDGEYIRDYTFVYSDTDANGHVNNGVYLRLMTDILPQELADRHFRNISVNFARECMQGETISLYMKREEDTCFIYGRTAAEKNNFEICAVFNN